MELVMLQASIRRGFPCVCLLSVAAGETDCVLRAFQISRQAVGERAPPPPQI